MIHEVHCLTAHVESTHDEHPDGQSVANLLPRTAVSGPTQNTAYADDLSSPYSAPETSNHGVKRVRLLRMQTPTIGSQDFPSCELQSFALADAPDYHAISYSWGRNVNRDVSLHILGMEATVSITPDVLAAIQAVSTMQPVQWIWLDAICIDQYNLREKGGQVQVMGSIYARATSVVVWLGSAVTVATPSEATDHMTFDQALRDLGLSAEKLESLMAQRSSVWYRRLWVIQEIVAARELWVCIGANTMPWDRFVACISADLWSSRPAPGTSAARLRRMLGSAQSQFRRLDGLRQSFGDAVAGRPLLELLRMSRYSYSSLPRDNIYALLGLATTADRQAIRVDYDAPLAVVFAEVTVHLIRSSGSFNILFDCWPRRPCNLGRHAEGSGLPAWVPDFSHPPVESWTKARPYTIQTMAVDTKPSIRYTSDYQETESDAMPGVRLSIEAYPLDTVRQVFGSDWNTVDTTQALDMLGALADMSAYDYTVADSSNECDFDSFWEALLLQVGIAGETTTALKYRAVMEQVLRCSSRRERENAMGSMTIDHRRRIERFAALLAASTRKRSLFTTSSSRFGVGHTESRDGDLIILPLGDQRPIVLRQVYGTDGFTLIDSCILSAALQDKTVPDDVTKERRWFNLT